MKITWALCAALAASGCATHYEAPTVRRDIAYETCEAQYQGGRQNYLSAVQELIAAQMHPDAAMAPLNDFRAEVNAAYNTVVQRCKTHMHCLEAHRYNEAKCYIAASERTGAENRFKDLSTQLRIIQNQMMMFNGAIINSPSVEVTTSVNNTNKQKQGQEQKQKQKAKADAHNGHEIDQDVLAICGNVDGLLKERCRRPCRERC